ncbi:MAG: MarR family winged helix-turn-helix transcriptional regulator [Opitutae bacterium]|nr:MarR family winged helix-turn-helix transcriptional regulator [Opitutae bacterium]
MATESDIPAWQLLFEVAKRIRKNVARSEKWLMDRHTVAQVRTFEEIMGFYPEGVSLRDLAKSRGITAGTASVTVSSLVAAGLVARTRATHDRRSVRLLPTKKALRREEKIGELSREFFEKSLAGTTPEERENFVKLLGKMLANLKNS